MEENTNTQITPLEPETITIPADQLAGLLDKLKIYEEKEDKVAEMIAKAMEAIGLIDKNTGELIPELKEGGTKVVLPIIRAIKDNFSISGLLMGSKKAINEVVEKFSFFKEAQYIFEDYNNRKKADNGRTT